MDPEVRALEGGAKVARLRIATTERIYNRQTQETKEHTEWHTVTLWRGLADVADRYVRKGSQVYIEGSLRTREWTDKDNNKRYTTEIVANDMKMLGRRAEGTGAPMDGTTYGAPARPAAAAPQPSYGTPAHALSSLRDLCQQIQELNEERFSDNDLDDLMQQMTTVINDMERE